MPNTTKTINKVEPVNPESDNNNGTPASLTSELAKDIKTFTTAVKSNLANVTAIFPFIAVGIWLFCLIVGLIARWASPGLSIVQFVFLIFVVIIIMFAWKKTQLTKNIKNKNVGSVLLLISFVVSAIALFISVFYIPTSYIKTWSWEPILIIEALLGLVGITLLIVAGALFLKDDSKNHSAPHSEHQSIKHDK